MTRHEHDDTCRTICQSCGHPAYKKHHLFGDGDPVAPVVWLHLTYPWMQDPPEDPHQVTPTITDP